MQEKTEGGTVGTDFPLLRKQIVNVCLRERKNIVRHKPCLSLPSHFSLVIHIQPLSSEEEGFEELIHALDVLSCRRDALLYTAVLRLLVPQRSWVVWSCNQGG